MISIKTNNASSPVFPLSYACKTEGTLFILTRKIRGGKYEEAENKEMQMRKEGKDGPTRISRSIFFQKIRFLFSKYIIVSSAKLIDTMISDLANQWKMTKNCLTLRRQMIRLDMARWVMLRWKYLKFYFILIFLLICSFRNISYCNYQLQIFFRRFFHVRSSKI